MNRTLTSFVLVTGVVLGSGTAYAADLPTKAPRQTYAPDAFTWTGFYAGINAGYGWTDGSGTISFGPLNGPVSGRGNGFLAGAQAGYNYQFGSFVAGIEGDINYDATRGNFDGGAGPIAFTSTAKVPYFATARARLGYANDRWLYYVTGGAVYGEGKLEGTINTSGAFTSTRNFWTYTVGGGVEAMIWDRWSAKLEYLYIATPNHIPLPPGATAIDGTINTHIVRVGLNYHF